MMNPINSGSADAPVGPYSPPEAIQAWVSQLEAMPSDPEVQSSIDEAKAWLEIQKNYMSIA